MSSFNGVDYFGSGPHAFCVGTRGTQTEMKTKLGTIDAGRHVLGLMDLIVVVRGRLVAANQAALDTILEAIETVVQDDPEKKDLVDNHGHTFESVDFIEFRRLGGAVSGAAADRGRGVSMAYEAVFMKRLAA